MPGLIHGVEDDINTIRNLLQDYQRGSAILKELIQNAEDAGASRLDILVGVQIVSPRHPLLKAPAIVILNDGPFTPENSKAIRQIHASQKASESTAIGKYGLGLKSVFHLCEAFFYVGSSEASEVNIQGLLNPWAGSETNSDPQFNPQWELTAADGGLQVSDELATLRSSLGYTKDQAFFGLWIPLRTSTTSRYSIRKVFPGENPQFNEMLSWILDSDKMGEIPSLMPMLRNLTTICIWDAGEHGFDIPFAKVSVNPGSTRLNWVPEIESEKHFWNLTGRITSDGDSNRNHIFAGVESNYEDTQLQEIRNQEAWPTRSQTIDDEFKDIEEKAESHAAAYFVTTERPGVNGLSVFQSVFLPVNELFLSEWHLGFSLHLMLHGYYLINSSRTDIDFTESVNGNDVASVSANWNKQLRNNHVLPSIPSALKQLYKDDDLPEIQQGFDTIVEHIDKFLRASPEFIELSTQQNQWVYKINGPVSDWTLVNADQPLLDLPDPSEINLRKLFPRLSESTDGFIVTSTGRPRISSTPVSPWPPQILAENSAVDAGAFNDPKTADYLARFIKSRDRDFSSAPNAKLALFKSFKEYISTSQTDKLSGQEPELSAITSALNWPFTFGIPISNDPEFACALIREISKTNADVLCVPESWIGDLFTGSSEIDIAQIAKLMKTLLQVADKSNSKDQVNIVSAAIRNLFTLSGDLENTVDRYSSEKIFEAFDCARSELRLCSADELKSAHGNKLLFRGSPQNQGLANNLQSAIANTTVLIANQHTLSSLGEAGQSVRPCNAESCVGALTQQPDLAAPNDRTQLLRNLLTDVSSKSAVKTPSEATILSVRYLVHSRREKFDNLDQLLVWDSQSEDVWQAIAQIITSSESDNWKIVDKELGNEFNSIQAEFFRIGPLGQQTVESMLSNHENLGSLDLSSLELSDRLVLMSTLAEDVLTDLPMHKTIDGNLVQIDNNSYVLARGDTFPSEDHLSGFVTLLQMYEDARANLTLRDLVKQRIWTPSAAIEYALNTNNPVEHGSSIVSALKILKANTPVQGPVHELLRKTSWLLTSDSTPISPDRILYLSDAQDLVSQIANLSNGEYKAWSKLDAEFTDEKTISVLAVNVFDSPAATVETIGLILDDNPDFTIGIEAAPQTHAELMDWLEVVDGIPTQTLPAGKLVKDLVTRKDVKINSAILNELIPVLAKCPPSTKLVDILEFLVEKQEQRSSVPQLVGDYHKKYLVDAASHPQFSEKILPRIRLPNDLGQWISTTSLCAFATNIDPQDRLNDQYERKLEHYLPSNTERGSARSGKDGSSLDAISGLLDHLDDWSSHTSPELVGTLLAILGNHELIEKAAKKHLKRSSYDLDFIRSSFGWTADPSTNSEGWLAEPNGAQVIGSTTFDLSLSSGESGETTQVLNLLAKPFNARIGKILEHIAVTDGIVLPLKSLRLSDRRVVKLTLAKRAPESFGRRADEVLRNTIYFIWQKAYQQSGIPDELWDAIGEEDQLHISTIQALVSETLIDRIDQYRNISNEVLKQLKIIWEDLRFKKQQVIESDVAKGSKLAAIETKRSEVTKVLVKLLQENTTVQNSFLESTRETVRESNYLPSVILFELFQNADDAVAELQMLGNTPNEPYFVVMSSKDDVTIAHWGRQLTRQSGPSGNHPRFKTDLQKMLVMHASDKSSSGTNSDTTGKFGLGFKSIYLATDTPVVLSERIGFKVIGGVYPESLDTEERKELKHRVELSRHNSTGATIIGLPLRETKVEELVNRFEQLRSILHVFARQIKGSDINGDKFNWEPKVLASDHLVEHGSIDISGSDGNYGLLVIRNQSGSAIALPIKSSKFVRFPREIPTVWVTAPTAEKSTIGFTINGDFAIDAGRAKILSEHDRNQGVLNELSRQVAISLNSLASELESGTDELGIGIGPSDSDLYEFWKSLWKLLHPNRIDNDDFTDQYFARQLFWIGGSAAMPILIKQKKVMPSCLTGDYASLVGYYDVTHVVSGVIEHPLVFPAISRLPSFKQAFEPGRVVSESEVATPLSKVGMDLESIKSISLVDVIRSAFPDGRVTSESAHTIGDIFNQEFLEKIESINLKYGEEIKNLWQVCEEELKFQAMDGSWATSADLLIANKRYANNPDEPLRAAFAPNSRVISDKYSISGIEFFKSARNPLDTPLKLLVQWAVQADSETRQNAVIHYMLRGELSRRLGQLLAESDTPEWLDPSDLMESSNALSEMDRYDQGIVISVLGGPSDDRVDVDTGESYPQPEISPLDPKTVLEAIYDWWSGEGVNQLSRFDNKIYPDGQPLSLTSDPSRIRTDMNNRRAWLELFTLGATHTLGRVTEEQNAGFINLARDKQWFDQLVQSNVDSSVWGRILEEFFKNASDRHLFFYWFGLLPNIYQFSSWLDDYAQGFLNLDRRGPVGLLTILEPRSDSRLSGTGSDAPSIKRALGYGASFVVRELLRSGVLTSPDAAVHAYVPRRTTVRFLESIGLTGVTTGPHHLKSKLISDFLTEHLGDRSTFEGDFDIPLRIASENRTLWHEFLGTNRPSDL